MMVDFFSKNRSNKIIIHVDSKSDINEFSCFSAYSKGSVPAEGEMTP